MMNYYIGIDIGTTSTKGILFTEDGKVIEKLAKEYPIIATNNYQEQDPMEIFNAVLFVLKNLLAGYEDSVSFISFSSMMHSIMAVDEEGNPLTNLIIWADNRSKDYVKVYKNNGVGLKYYKKTGTPIHPMSPLYKLMWLRDNKSEIFKQAFKFISIKEFVFYKLFNTYVIDYSIASATGIFNIFTLTWDEEILNDIGIDDNRLAKPVPTTYILNEIKDEYKKQLNLINNIPFVIGASDGVLANLGSGAIYNNTAAVTIGTSGAVRVALNQPLIDDKGRVFSYILAEKKYIIGGAINNGGIVYRWFRDNFANEEKIKAIELNIDAYDILNSYVKDTLPGSNGLIFLPFLSGERAPYWNSDLKGAFIGIKNSNNKYDFTRAIIEGICYDLRDVFEVLKGFGEIETIFANGGFIRSKEWVQILTDILGIEIDTSDNYDSSITGAFLLGLLATNKIEQLEDSTKLVQTNEKYIPNRQNHKFYNERFSIYQDLINRLMPVLDKL